MRLLLLLLLLGAPAIAEELETERALVVTLVWEGESTITVDTIDRKEAVVPVQRGFPQLFSRFFELRDKDGDVHYSGPIEDPRKTPHAAPKGKASGELVLPDLEHARRLVIFERVSKDPDTGRKTILETDL